MFRSDTVKDESGTNAALFFKNKARLRLKWHQQKWWMLFRGDQDSLVRHRRSSGSSRQKSVQTIWWTNVRKTGRGRFIGTCFGKSIELGMSVCLPKVRSTLIGVRGRRNCSKEAEGSRIWLSCGRNWWNTLILTNQLHFFITYIWDVLKVNANRMKLVSMNLQRCLNHVFCWSNWNFLTG